MASMLIILGFTSLPVISLQNSNSNLFDEKQFPNKCLLSFRNIRWLDFSKNKNRQQDSINRTNATSIQSVVFCFNLCNLCTNLKGGSFRMFCRADS